MKDAERTAADRASKREWAPVIDATGQVRDVDDAALVEITDLLSIPRIVRPGCGSSYTSSIRIPVSSWMVKPKPGRLNN